MEAEIELARQRDHDDAFFDESDGETDAAEDQEVIMAVPEQMLPGPPLGSRDAIDIRLETRKVTRGYPGAYFTLIQRPNYQRKFVQLLNDFFSTRHIDFTFIPLFLRGGVRDIGPLLH